MVFDNVLQLIGKTPMLKLNNMVGEDSAEVYLKLEMWNPGRSVKDRAALGMIERAEETGLLKKGGIIVEPTSGNTGIALAMIGRLKGYHVIIIMPETMSVERRNMIKAYGAELVLTEGTKGMKGAISKAEEIAEERKGVYIPQQFMNEANPNKHYATTAEEIIEDVNQLDAFVAAVGTGGTITGVGKRLKQLNANTKVYAVEPAKSPVLSGGQPGPHKIQGIGAGFVPDNYDAKIIDEIFTVTEEEAFEAARLVAQKEGVLIGISSGANVAIALKVAKRLGKGHSVVTIACDGGEKYLSMGLFE